MPTLDGDEAVADLDLRRRVERRDDEAVLVAVLVAVVDRLAHLGDVDERQAREGFFHRHAFER